VLDLLPQRVFWKDLAGNYLGSNRTFAADHGLESVIGLNVYQLGYSAVEAAQFEQSDQQTITVGEPMHDQVVEVTTAGGQPQWVSYSKVPLRSAQGAIIGVLGSYLDVTSFKETEFALTAANREAQSASRAKTDFLSTMSHEIRTPLNGVLGCAELLRDTSLAPEQRHLADTIQHCGQSLLTLLNDILDISKIEAGSLRLERIHCSLRDICAEVIEILAPQALDKGLELTLHVDARADAIIKSDPTRIRQVVSNLLGNALKFTAHGGVIVDLGITSHAHLRVAVSDSGIGIPVENHAAIFEKFTQADSSTTRRFGGSGLGLAISKKLIEALGGEIGLSSTPDVGSTFWFTLPCAAELQLEDSAASATLAWHSQQRVSVLSAYAPRRAALVQELSALGIDAQGMDSPEAARGFIRAGEPSVVLFDFLGPDQGTAVATRLRGLNPQVRLIPMCSIVALQTLDRSQYDALILLPLTRRAVLLDALLQATETAEPENAASRPTRLRHNDDALLA
jgi:PAS domain S-box-containing protein